jgi:hypothetical protein
VENIPFQGGGTIAVLLPVQVQGQPVTLALGGLAERVRGNFDRYLAALKFAAKSVTPAQDFDTPVQIEP